jgi:hypothetical protein
MLPKNEVLNELSISMINLSKRYFLDTFVVSDASNSLSLNFPAITLLRPCHRQKHSEFLEC